MQPLTRGLYTARIILGDDDLTEAQALRHLAFRRGAGGNFAGGGLDHDVFDTLCRHVLVQERAGALVACCRVQSFGADRDLSASYAAQFYDLTRLARFPGPKLELGRFCLHPARQDPDILRLIWAALTALVDTEGVTLIFGCSSFPGADPVPHLPALAALRPFAAPLAYAPGPRARQRVAVPDGQASMTGLPPLLRTYLAMGGWVSDHAVIDRDLDTVHVLTGLDVSHVPAARARSLRGLALGFQPTNG